MSDSHGAERDAGRELAWYERGRSWVGRHRIPVGGALGLTVVVAGLGVFADVPGFFGAGPEPAPTPRKASTSHLPTAPRPTGTSTDPAVASSWTQRLRQNENYDFDVVGGKDAGNSRANDIVYRAAAKALAPPEQSGAKFRRVGVRAVARIAGISCPDDGYADGGLPVSRMPVNFVFCMLTSEGRHARVSVLDVQPSTSGHPALHVRVWVKEGARR